MNTVFKSVLYRFIRGGLAGAVATMITLAPFSGNSFGDFANWFALLTLAGTVGMINGILLAVDKYFRMEK